MTKTNRQKYSDAIQAAERIIRKEHGHKTICSDCSATGTTYLDGTSCEADLDEACLGFKYWDELRSAEIDRQLKKVGLDILGHPIK